jgi:hypothetical protein
MDQSNLIDSLADAIQRMEGGRPGDINMRNNNPGNLRSWGHYPIVNGYVQFPDYQTGRDALKSQIRLLQNRGLNLYEFFGGQRDENGNVIPGGYSGYAPAADSNQPNHYAQVVAGWLGISADAPLSSIASVNPQIPPATKLA